MRGDTMGGDTMRRSSGYAIVIGVVGSDTFTTQEKNETCEKDALDVAEFVKTEKRFTLLGPLKNGTRAEEPFLTDSATKQAIKGVMDDASGKMQAGDILLVFFSGHGGSKPHGLSGEEAQYVCLKSGNLWDFEWNQWLSEFEEDRRVLSIVDSCYGAGFGPSMQLIGPGDFDDQACPRPRLDPQRIAQVVWDTDTNHFEQLRAGLGRSPLRCWYLQLSACQGNQLACTDGENGKFTKVLLEVARKRGNLNYRQLHREILKQFRATQSPSYYSRGTIGDEFGKQTAFSI